MIISPERQSTGRRQIAQLFLLGQDSKSIAHLLDLPTEWVDSTVEALLCKWMQRRENPDREAAIDLARLDVLLATTLRNAQTGNTRAAALALAIIRERGELLGYYQGVDAEAYVRQVAEANGYDADTAVEIAVRVAAKLNK